MPRTRLNGPTNPDNVITDRKVVASPALRHDPHRNRHLQVLRLVAHPTEPPDDAPCTHIWKHGPVDQLPLRRRQELAGKDTAAAVKGGNPQLSTKIQTEVTKLLMLRRPPPIEKDCRSLADGGNRGSENTGSDENQQISRLSPKLDAHKHHKHSVELTDQLKEHELASIPYLVGGHREPAAKTDGARQINRKSEGKDARAHRQAFGATAMERLRRRWVTRFGGSRR